MILQFQRMNPVPISNRALRFSFAPPMTFRDSSQVFESKGIR